MTSPVTSIVVRASADSSDQQTDIVEDAVEFVYLMMEKGAYLREELPGNALRAYHTDFYLAQVANGGHAQFIENSGWAADIVKDISEGLAAMKAEPYGGIFADLRRLVDSGRATPEALSALDDRFFKHDVYETFSPFIAHWLRSLPELEVVADKDYQPRLEQLYDANPGRTARLAERARLQQQANARDPLWVAANLLCTKANCLPVHGFTAGDPVAVSPDGRTGGWAVSTGAGIKMLFLFDDIAYLCDIAYGDHNVAEKINRERLAKAGVTGSDDIDTTVYTEIASIPASAVSAAVEKG